MTEQEQNILATLTNERISDISAKEYKKALYWIEKQVGSDGARRRTADQLDKDLRRSNKRVLSTPLYTFKGELFTWVHMLSSHKVDGGVMRIEDDACIYGEGCDLGFFIRTGTEKGKPCLIFFTSEFLTQVEKKFLLEENPDRMETIRQFLAHNPAFHSERWPKEDGTEDCLIFFEAYIAKGAYVSDDRWVMTDIDLRCMAEEYYFGDESQATDSERKRYRQAVALFEGCKAHVFNPSKDDNVIPKYLSPDYYRQYLSYLSKLIDVSEEFSNIWLNMAYIIGDLVYDASEHEVMPPMPDGDDDYRRFFASEVGLVVEPNPNLKLSEAEEYIFGKIVKATLRILEYQKYECPTECVTSFLNDNKIWQKMKSTYQPTSKNDMDKNMTQQLRRIMKSHGLRDKYENLIKSTRTTVEAWFEWVEPLYAVARLHSYITNEKDRPKFLAADKEWTEYVINEDKCAALNEYIDRHTKPVVIQAVHYLMDNGIWEAPLGIEGIRKANADLYKGVKAIDEAVEFLRSEGKLAEAPERQPEPILDFTDDVDDTATGKRTDAQRAFNYCNEALNNLQERFETLSQYFEKDELVDLLEKANTKLTKENARLTESIKVVNQQYSDAKKEVERQKQTVHDANKARDTAIDNFNKLQKQYNEMKEDYDYLKREAQKAQETPKVKLIPASKLRALPLIGDKAMSVLTPLLKSYNIVVDENK